MRAPVGSETLPPMFALTCGALSRGNEMKNTTATATMLRTFLVYICFPPQLAPFTQMATARLSELSPKRRSDPTCLNLRPAVRSPNLKSNGNGKVTAFYIDEYPEAMMRTVFLTLFGRVFCRRGVRKCE